MICLLRKARNVAGAHPASYSMDTGLLHLAQRLKLSEANFSSLWMLYGIYRDFES